MSDFFTSCSAQPSKAGLSPSGVKKDKASLGRKAGEVLTVTDKLQIQ